MFIGCMVTLSLSCVGLALVPTHAYAGLMLLRCLQAFGSASTVALGACPLSGSVSSSSALESEGEICFESRADATRSFAGAGVIADIAAPFERGSFFGLWNIGPMIGPSLGPVLGGALSDKLGWRYGCPSKIIYSLRSFPAPSRSIFWFLVISSGICAVIMIL